MNRTIAKQQGRISRHNRIRAKIAGTAARPRLSVYKSNRYLHAQIIDDSAHKTLVGLSTKALGKVKKMEAAQKLGEEIAKAAKAAGVEAVVFDRGGFRYAGRMATFADAVRKGGVTM